MPWYRTEDGSGTMHLLIRGKGSPASCMSPALEGDNLEVGERCGRMAPYLCDFVVGHLRGGKASTCDAPMCERHRTRVGDDRDHCPKHQTDKPDVNDSARRLSSGPRNVRG